MKTLDWPELQQLPGIGLQYLEYGPGGDHGYLLAWQGTETRLGYVLTAILPHDERADDGPPDAGSEVTNRARFHTLLRWLATCTAPADAARLALLTAQQAARLPQPGADGWRWQLCTIPTTAPTYGEARLLILATVPMQHPLEATEMLRWARAVAKLGLLLEASQQ